MNTVEHFSFSIWRFPMYLCGGKREKKRNGVADVSFTSNQLESHQERCDLINSKWPLSNGRNSHPLSLPLNFKLKFQLKFDCRTSWDSTDRTFRSKLQIRGLQIESSDLKLPISLSNWKLHVFKLKRLKNCFENEAHVYLKQINFLAKLFNNRTCSNWIDRPCLFLFDKRMLDEREDKQWTWKSAHKCFW